MEVQITIDWHNVLSAVRKHLSIIGKRTESSDGTTQYGKITISSAEEDILHQYVNAAGETFVSNLEPLVTYYNSGDFLVFSVDNPRWGMSDGISVPFEGNFMGYVVAYCLYSLLGMYAPDSGARYQADMQNHLAAAQRLIYTKVAPTSSGDELKDMKGAMYLDDGMTEFNGTNA